MHQVADVVGRGASSGSSEPAHDLARHSSLQEGGGNCWVCALGQGGSKVVE
jgi:hypothetical protein